MMIRVIVEEKTPVEKEDLVKIHWDRVLKPEASEIEN